MFSINYAYGLASGYPELYFDESLPYSYAQDHPNVYPSMPGGFHAPVLHSEVSPWAWQWNEETRVQEGPFTHPYTASITQPQVQPTYAVDRAPPAFCRVVGGPVLNVNRPEIACPRPIHPLPSWINVAEWEDDEYETTPKEDEERTILTPGPVDNDNDTDWEGEESSDEEDYDEERDVLHQLLPPFMRSPDPEDLPAPFFPPSSDPTPSSRTFASLSPKACDLPQPCFSTDPDSPVSNASSWPSVPGLGYPRSPWSDLFLSPDPEDLPPPVFEIYDRAEAGELDPSGPFGHCPDRSGERDTQGHARRLDEGSWKAVTSEERKVSGSGNRRRWLDWIWGK